MKATSKQTNIATGVNDMTAWTDAIDVQIAALDAYVVELNENLATYAAAEAVAAGQRLDEIQAVIIQTNQIISERSDWRARLVEARELGYLPDINTRFYEERGFA